MTRNRRFIITTPADRTFSLDCLTLLNVLVPLTGRGADNVLSSDNRMEANEPFGPVSYLLSRSNALASADTFHRVLASHLHFPPSASVVLPAALSSKSPLILVRLPGGRILTPGDKTKDHHLKDYSDEKANILKIKTFLPQV